jgi:hypothetical protein
VSLRRWLHRCRALPRRLAATLLLQEQGLPRVLPTEMVPFLSRLLQGLELPVAPFCVGGLCVRQKRKAGSTMCVCVCVCVCV